MVPPLVRPVYGMAPGLVQLPGRLDRARLPAPPPGVIGTPPNEYAPAALLNAGPTAEPPVGVADTPTPFRPPPRLLEIVPLMVPTCTGQVTEKFTVAVAPLVTVADWLAGVVHPAGRPDVIDTV